MTHLQVESGPERVANKPKIKPNQLSSAQHHHGPSPEDNRRQPNEDGLIWSRPWRTPTGPFGPEFGQLLLPPCPMSAWWFHPGSMYLEVNLVPSMRGWSIIQMTPSSLSIKRDSPLLTQLQHTSKEHKSIKEQEQEHHSMGLGPR